MSENPQPGRAARCGLLPAILLLLLASCTGPASRRSSSSSELPGADRGLEGRDRGAVAASQAGALELRVRREPSSHQVLALSVPAGSAHGPAAVALANAWRERLELRLRELGGMPSVEVRPDHTVFQVIVAEELWREGLDALHGILREPPAEPLALRDVVAAARGSHAPTDPWVLAEEDPQAVRRAFYRPDPARGRAALGLVGPVSLREASAFLKTRQAGSPEAPPPTVPSPGGREVWLYRRSADYRVHLHLPAPHPLDPAGASTTVLARLLGGVLGEALAERVGATSLEARHTAGSEGGVLSLRFLVRGEPAETAALLAGELADLEAASLDPAAVRRASREAGFGLVDRIDRTAGQAGLMAAQTAVGVEGKPARLFTALLNAGSTEVAEAAGMDRGDRFKVVVEGPTRPSFLALEDLASLWRGGSRPLPPEAPGASDTGATLSDLREHALAGGGRLLHQSDSALPLVAMAVRFPGGRLQESRREAGSTRLLVESVRLMLETGALAGGIARVRAVETPDAFGLDLVVLPEDLGHLAEEALELLRGSKSLDPEAVRLARGALSGSHGHLGARAEELLGMAAFPDHPYGRPSQGLSGAVSAMGAREVERWRSVAGSGPGVVALVGDIAEEEALGSARRWAVSLRARPDSASATPAGEIVAGSRRSRAGGGRSAVAIGYGTPGRGEPATAGLPVLAALLRAEGGSGLFSQEAGELVWAEWEAMEGVGLFTLVAYGPAGTEDRMESALRALLQRSPDLFTEEAVRRAERSARLLDWLGRTGLGDRAGRGALESLFGRDPSGTIRPEASLEEMGALARELAASDPAVARVEGFPR